jgi:hypothetical protein
VIFAIRVHNGRYTLGEPYLRKRDKGLSIELRKPGHHKRLSDALKSLERRLASATEVSK